MSLVPITINPHLVPFFFKEGDGKVSAYGNKRVKPVLFSAASSIGKIMRLLMVKSNRPQDLHHFNLVLTISDNGYSKNYSGEFYKFVNGRNTWLKLPQEANSDINDLLEDIFKMSFIAYVNGCVENNDDSCIVDAINKFIDKYDLLEFGFSNDTMRKQYYREKEKNTITARFQKPPSPKMGNFCV